MRFLSLLSFGVASLFSVPGFAFAGTAEKSSAAEAVAEAKERHRRAELLAIAEELRGIYADFGKSDIPDLERSRRLAPIAARYENLLQRFPDDPEALVLYAKFLRDGGDDDGAREYFEKAQKIEPSWAVVYQQLAAIAAERGEVQSAFPLMQKAVELDPGQAVYQLQLGELLATFREELLEGKFFDTREALDRAMQNAFRAARALAPKSADVAMRYAESFYDVEKADWRAAAEAWSAVRKIVSEFPRVGMESDAEVLMKESLDLHQARVCVELGELDRAENLLRGVTDERLISSRERLRKMIFEKTHESLP